MEQENFSVISIVEAFRHCFGLFKHFEFCDHDFIDYSIFLGENTVNGDQSDAHMSTLSQSSKEVIV